MNDAEEQISLWNGSAGKAWVDSQELLDRVLAPFEDVILEADLGARVLDVGCGTGSTALAISKRSSVVGVDISEPMLALAKRRAEAAKAPATFVLADAASYAFTPPPFDTVVSRFGVMFFEDPVRAFENLRRAARRLRMVAWRSAAENEFMTTAERAAAPLLPAPPPKRPGAPGQFAFGERERVVEILEGAGWRDVDVSPLDRTCSMPASALVPYVTRLGPVGRVLHELDEATRRRVVEKLEAAFQPFVAGDEVRFVGATWLITANA